MCTTIKGYSRRTIIGYEDSFKLFFKNCDVSDVQKLSRDVMEDYFYYGRKERKWSSVTFRTHFKRFNAFFKWCVKRDIIEKNPMDGIEKPRLEKRIPRRLSRNQATEVLEVSYHLPYHTRYERFRNRAIIGIMLLAGLRKSEVIHLRLQDVDIENKSIFINQAKGKKDRIVPISSRLILILSDYLKERKRTKKMSIQFFTGVNEKRPFGNQAVKHLIKKLRDSTKLDFSAHTLRHSFATLTLEGGCDLFTLSKLMGHEKVTTTAIYLACTTGQKLRGIEKNGLNDL